jgi:hypothetical protein
MEKRRESRPWKRGTAEVQEQLRIRAIKNCHRVASD